VKAIELFSGVGGLAIGVSMADFDHLALVEIDKNACRTIRVNQDRCIYPIADWPLYEMDVRRFDYSPLNGNVDLLCAGAPCQPFSLGGKHKAHQDERDMFPEAIRAVQELQPKAVLLENVRGLTRKTFADYFAYILLQLRFPEIKKREGDTWMEHLDHLRGYESSGARNGLMYDVAVKVLNAADYGVPQIRERVIIVAIRTDLDVEWSYPEPTHSIDALLFDQWISGDYWDRHRMSKAGIPERPQRFASRIETLRCSLGMNGSKPWLTVRDGLGDLLDLNENGGKNGYENHEINPGARSYPGHTGSSLDWPAKTLKAGVHGVPGGENMLVDRDGSVRYFTIRECARLQTFPDDYYFPCSWTESLRQLGNAVPVSLGYRVASRLRAMLDSA
jgi:DNA (cytosine-5)-methyltransferase 1